MSASNDEAVRPFQVHLRGIVELLSRSIYSTPHAFLRELLQNGVDAISARRDEPGGPGEGGDSGSEYRSTGIRITPVSPESPVFAVEDDGIGLTGAEVAELLATVGRSSKRDVLDLPRTDRLGQFGIGLLSCFMVADDIVVRSRSARGGAPVEWVGRADGTFTVRELQGAEAEAVPVGSRVELTPRAGEGELVSEPLVSELARRYGQYLPVPISIERPGGVRDSINRAPLFAEPFTRPSAELLELGHEFLGVAPFDAIELHVPGTRTRGTAFVLPFAPSPGSRAASTAYLGGMLLAERAEDLLPEWAFFVRAIVDSQGLHPTASRESFMEDDALEQTRAELGAALRRWVLQLATTSPGRLAEFLAIHHLALRGLALHDDELAAFIVPHLTVETSGGTTTLGELARATPHIRYTESLDEFRQIAGIARADAPVVNGGYVYDADLVRRLPELIPGVTVEAVRVADELDALDEPPLADRLAAQELERRATAALADLDCRASVRSFSPTDITALYVADPDVIRRFERATSRKAGGALWGGILGRIDEAAAEEEGEEALGRLALNWRNRLVRTLAGLDDELVFVRTVRILYVQALLAGHRPLRTADRSALTEAMTDIVHLSVGLGRETTTTDDAQGD